jgi:tetratricopeptide (TPR) repeat protein
VIIRHYLILAGVVSALLLCGCAPKKVSKGTPFDLDKLFVRDEPVVTEETNKEKGIRLAREKDYATAIEAFKKHVEENPENFFGFNAIAVCCKNMGEQAEAIKNFERALEFADSPEDRAKVLANIGNLYFSSNQFQAALGLYKEAASEFDKNPLYLILIAKTFLVLGENDRARRVLSTVEQAHKDLDKHEPNEDKGFGAYIMANCYAALNEEDKVFNYLESAIKANPDKYIAKIQTESSDPRSLFYSLQGDPRLTKIIDRYKRNKG